MSLTEPLQQAPPSQSVVRIVAERKGVAPEELSVPLFDAVDPEALDTIVRSTRAGRNRSPVRITFSYYGYDVEVSSDGSVTVSSAE